jgi:predicted RND superfamily exporter protein
LKSTVLKYYRAYLKQPLVALLVITVLGIFAGYSAKGFYYDASADTLVAENDPDLLYYRKISNFFGGESFLFLTYTPKNHDLVSAKSVEKIAALEASLEEVKGVKSVTSLLDAPLLKSPPIPIAKIATNYRTLRTQDVDFDAAFKELTTSPLFSDLLISSDGQTTAFRIDLEENPELQTLSEARNKLRLLKKQTREDKKTLEKVNAAYRKAYAKSVTDLEQTLNEIRAIRYKISNEATSYLGGVPMIASDMMRYVKSDLISFGGASILLMIVSLFAFFRKARWVILPIASTAVTVLMMLGLLGFLHKPVTVISSNFVSLLIILSISIVVHLVTKYREILDEHRSLPHIEVVFRTMTAKFAPCIYTTLTTIAGFASLSTSSIIPVMDFGWIMCTGVFMAFLVGFLFFPVALLLLPKEVLTTPARDNSTPFIRHAYRTAFNKTNKVLLATLGLAIAIAVGISTLSLDNRFIDYFKEDTEINRGLTFIDQNLGGTIPMDIIVSFPPYVEETLDEEDDFFDEGSEQDLYPERYWFTPDKIETLRKMETYLTARPEIGKVISLATLEEIAQSFNDDKPLNAVELVAIMGALPEHILDNFIDPYAQPRQGLMRISTRIHETGPLFSRDKLIKDIEQYAINELKMEKGAVKATGMNVLFNGMLKELFSSQASTLIFVIGATLTMFWVLLRCVSLAIIGLLPNLLAAFAVLGFMGFVGIPMDMMTITITAIVIGIGVDDAIHYLHNFKIGYLETKDVDAGVRKSHREIGRAIYITSLTVIIGFSVLCASNFVPTVYFGLLTALAMVFALAANLVLLPAMLLKFYK